MKGCFKRNGQQIPVAVKTLKHDDIPNAEVRLVQNNTPCSAADNNSYIYMLIVILVYFTVAV